MATVTAIDGTVHSFPPGTDRETVFRHMNEYNSGMTGGTADFRNGVGTPYVQGTYAPSPLPPGAQPDVSNGVAGGMFPLESVASPPPLNLAPSARWALAQALSGQLGIPPLGGGNLK